MALIKVGESALVKKEVLDDKDKKKVPKKNVLDEDAYTEVI